MTTFRCSSCNAPLQSVDKASIISCQYCGAEGVTPKPSEQNITIQMPVSLGTSSPNQEGSTFTTTFTVSQGATSPQTQGTVGAPSFAENMNTVASRLQTVVAQVSAHRQARPSVAQEILTASFGNAKRNAVRTFVGIIMMVIIGTIIYKRVIADMWNSPFSHPVVIIEPSHTNPSSE